MHDSDNNGLINNEKLKTLDHLRRNPTEFSMNGHKGEFKRILGAGGSKTVYEVVIDGETFALGLPNAADKADIANKKWQVVQQEPHNTEVFRSLGLYTNPVCQNCLVEFHGFSFNAILSTPYSSLPYHVMDGKAAYVLSDIKTVLSEEYDRESFINFFSNIFIDLKVLIKNNLRVDTYDSISICIVDNKPRIFFTDLAQIEYAEETDREEIKQFASSCIDNAIGAFLSKLSEDDEKNMHFLLSSQSERKQVLAELLKKFLSMLNTQVPT